MAIKLAERAVDALVDLLQSNMSTELTAIDTDRGDGVTLAAPTADYYYKYPKAVIAGQGCHVEVFETGFDFTNQYTDPANQRAVYTLPVTIRITYLNRDGDNANTMATRGRRYATAAFNCVTKNYDIDETDAALKVATVVGVTTHWDQEGEDSQKVFKMQTAISVEVVCEETQS